ncbi:hypothetical protein CgunFtcFv8_024059 [Champsocephalus gunnari]|uniref:Uncharacterized protein n=1 Tax=Champsocephalus gunnari TaxID=52237 RepID=A0AAN8HKY3_CHAGU|nr:hypothetical protein CgunFtcFv8_024059 [Champsocephalus gunnari]
MPESRVLEDSPRPLPRCSSIWTRTTRQSGRQTMKTYITCSSSSISPVWLLLAGSGFIPLFSSCFPPEFLLPLRRGAEFHTGLDAPFVGSVSS